MIKPCIKIEFDYPGMNINSGWASTLKLDASMMRSNKGISVVRITKNENREDYIDATLKCYTLLSRMEDKIRVDIMHSGPNVLDNIKVLIKLLDHMASIKSKLSNIVNTYLECRDKHIPYNIIKSYEELEVYNNETTKEFANFNLKFSICLAKYDTKGGFINE